MQYEFYIQTTQGLKSATIETDSDFSCAPFGFVPYRMISSCTCEPAVIDDFWNCVDQVLAHNNLGEQDYIRAVRAYSNNHLYGELDPERYGL